MFNDRQYKWKNIIGKATTVVFTGSGTLGSIIINTANAGGTITITDAASPSANVGIITLLNSASVALPYNVSIAGGLTIVTSASPDITVTWAQ